MPGCRRIGRSARTMLLDNILLRCRISFGAASRHEKPPHRVPAPSPRDEKAGQSPSPGHPSCSSHLRERQSSSPFGGRRISRQVRADQDPARRGADASTGVNAGQTQASLPGGRRRRTVRGLYAGTGAQRLAGRGLGPARLAVRSVSPALLAFGAAFPFRRAERRSAMATASTKSCSAGLYCKGSP